MAFSTYPSESTPLTSPSSYQSGSSIASSDDSKDALNTKYDEFEDEDKLARKLLACNGNVELESIVMRRSLDISFHAPKGGRVSQLNKSKSRRSLKEDQSLFQKMFTMISLALLGLLTIFVLLQVSSLIVGPPSQPVGPYQLVEAQEGDQFFDKYDFYIGKDSAGSKGYVNYVSRDEAVELGIANVTWEDIDPYIFGLHNDTKGDESNTRQDEKAGKEPFVYMSTSSTAEGPRNSIRLEGLHRFNRGLFILDLRHMPAGCATWPAYWLTDEPNWPVNGEIDILEGVNGQTRSKTAMHSTKGCDMNDVPLGIMTGNWDTAVGVPKQNGDIDTTRREARDCFVYAEHQWLNQGCVATHNQKDTLGAPLNKKGGGVFVLEWDPINRFVKSWVFSPHTAVPDNLRRTLQSANNKDAVNRVRPDPITWGLPYAYFPIGKGTNCEADHFRNMHLIFNIALCGTVAGNRFFMDCPDLKAKYGSCHNYVNADTPAMDEVYWKIRGVYIYEREWKREWIDDIGNY
eukprot:scaffold10559_cov267-Chaetoceros_neogracile.AAC.9